MLRLYPGLGGFGGGLAPAAQDDIIQWLAGGTTDGLSLDYAVQTVASDAELRNAGSFYHDKSGYRLVQPNNFDLATTGFTISGVIRMETLTTTGAVISMATGTGAASVMMQVNTSGSITSLFAGDVSTPAGPGTISVGTDYEFSQVYDPDANEMTFIIDGTSYTAEHTAVNVADGNIHYGDGVSGTIPADVVFSDISFTPNKAEYIDVVLFGGQSNALGIGSSTPPSPLDTPQDDLYTIQTTGWGDATSSGTQLQEVSGQWGAELQMAYDTTEKIAVVKWGIGGATLSQFVPDKDEGWLQMTTALDDMEVYANSLGYIPRVTNFVWIQGEGDAGIESEAITYSERFQRFYQDIKDLTIVDDSCKLILYKLNSNTPGFAYLDTVIEQQRDIVANTENSVLLDVDDLELRDNVHYTEGSLVTFGSRIAGELNILGLETISGTLYHYPLVEMAEDEFYETSIYRNDASISGTHTIATVRSKTQDKRSPNNRDGFSQVGNFDGAGDALYRDAFSYTTSNVHHIEFWAKLDVYGSGASGYSMPIRAGSVFNTSGIDAYMLGGAGSRSIGCSGYYDGGSISVSGSILDAFDTEDEFLGVWRKWELHFEPLNNYLKISGRTIGSAMTDENEVVSGTGTFRIGHSATSGITRYWDGQIKDVQIGVERIRINEGDGATVTSDTGLEWTLDTLDEDAFWGVKIPASQASGDITGGALLNAKGIVHNVSECDIVQTDAAVFGAGTVNFWSADGSTLDEKTKAQLDTHHNNTNGSYNLWLRYGDDNTIESIQYALSKEFTPAEVLQNEAYFGGTSGALRDVNGELILDSSGYVIFVA